MSCQLRSMPPNMPLENSALLEFVEIDEIPLTASLINPLRSIWNLVGPGSLSVIFGVLIIAMLLEPNIESQYYNKKGAKLMVIKTLDND